MLTRLCFAHFCSFPWIKLRLQINQILIGDDPIWILKSRGHSKFVRQKLATFIQSLHPDTYCAWASLRLHPLPPKTEGRLFVENSCQILIPSLTKQEAQSSTILRAVILYRIIANKFCGVGDGEGERTACPCVL